MKAARHNPNDAAVAGQVVVLASEHERVEAELLNSDSLCGQWMAIATQHEARIAELEGQLAEQRRRSVIFDTDEALNQRLKASGMLTVDEMKAGQPLDGFIKHAGVINLASFGEWLTMRRTEALKMHSRMIVGDRENDDLFEWTLAHNAVFGEVAVNFKAAMAGEHPQLQHLDSTHHSGTKH